MKTKACHTLSWLLGGLACTAYLAGCGGEGKSTSVGAGGDALRATIGPEGGELVGTAGSALDGVVVVIPPGALASSTEITMRRADAATPLPSTAVGCGPEFTFEPAGLKLAVPADVTLPFDENTVADHDRFGDEVKVWALDGATWGQRLQTDSSEGRVTIQLDALLTVGAGVNPPAEQDIVHFELKPFPKFERCLASYPDDPSQPPIVRADVVRGPLNDGLFLRGKNIQPGLKFDMFTVENSSLLADGTPDPAFKNFGLAWYQSDLEADSDGQMRASIRTILLDQIFGFDPAVSLPPTGTFEVGFWFNDPHAASACGFDETHPTPFNGEHQAGPVAMITVPDATTGLGPLCTKPDTSVTPARCSP
jgi:ZU5 domain